MKPWLDPRLAGLLKVLATLGMVALILWKVGPDRITKAWAGANGAAVAIAAGLGVVVLFLTALKWKLMLNGSGFPVTWRRAAISVVAGMGVGLLTPMRIGELSRIFLLRGNREALLGVAAIDKTIDLESLLVLAAIGCAMAHWMNPAMIFGGLAALVLGLMLFPGLYTSVPTGLLRHLPFHTRIQRVLLFVKSVPLTVIFGALAVRFVVCAIDMIQFGVLVNAFGHADLIAIAVTYPLIVLVNAFPITIGGIGIREGTSALVLSSFGVPATVAVSASFLLFCINTLAPGLAGSWFVGHMRSQGQFQ